MKITETDTKTVIIPPIATTMTIICVGLDPPVVISSWAVEVLASLGVSPTAVVVRPDS